MNTASLHPARYSVLTMDGLNLGVLLEDPSTDRLFLRLRRDWEDVAPDEADVLEELESDLSAKAAEWGAGRLMDTLEDTLSNTVRLTERREAAVPDFARAVERLYREHVRSTVREYVTHLPRYSLAAAAGKFLENRDVEAEGWEEAPAGLKLTPGLFVARVAGRSMEPLIPDASLCVFRAGVAGSRQGRLLLVEDSGNRYAVKRYRSDKIQDTGGAWRHSRITLESLNPAFESWDLDPGAPEDSRYRIIAEFVQVLA